MRRLRCIPTLGIVCGLLASSAAPAHEPDGRVAFRYEWSAPHEAASPSTLRLTLTLHAGLQGIRLGASIPPATAVRVVSARTAGGSAVAGGPGGAWPPDGLHLGDLPSGAIVILDLAVTPPAAGGGILAFGLDASAGSVPVHEGVGVPVGTPGTPPVLRNGAAEFPAAHAEPRR